MTGNSPPLPALPGSASNVHKNMKSPFHIPPSAIISADEAQKRRMQSKHHTIAREGDTAIHAVTDPKTGVITIVGEMTRKQAEAHKNRQG